MAVTSANVLDEANCAAGDASQTFTFGGASSGSVSSAAPASTSASVTSTEVAVTSAQILAPSTPVESACSIAFVTVTRGASSSTSVAEGVATTSAAASSSSITEAASTTNAALSSASASAAVTSAAAQSQAEANPTTPVPVSRAGGVLQPSAAAESNPRDNTATRAFSSVSIKDSSGQCLFIDPTAGDFRENLIPVQLQACTGSAGEKFDFITAGVHVGLNVQTA